jgi:hypothetical protein
MAGMCHVQKVCFSMSRIGRGQNVLISIAEMCCGQTVSFSIS